MSKLRFRVVETAFKKKAATVETPAQRPGEYFAKYVFNREKMFKYLPSNVYAKLSLAREFKGEVATSASYGDVTRSYAGGGSDTWLEYGIGFNAKMSKGTNLYGEIEKTTGSVIRTKWRANMGLRYSF